MSIQKGPMTKAQFDYLCGLKNEILQLGAGFKDAVEAVCEQADIEKTDLNKMINAAIKDELAVLKEKAAALSDLIDTVLD